MGVSRDLKASDSQFALELHFSLSSLTNHPTRPGRQRYSPNRGLEATFAMDADSAKVAAKLAALNLSLDDLEVQLEPLFAQTLPETIV